MTKSPGYLLCIGDFKRPTSSYMGNWVTAIVRITITAFSISCKGHVRVLLPLLTIFASKKSPVLPRNFRPLFSAGGLEVTIAGTHCLHPARWGVKIGGKWDAVWMAGWRNNFGAGKRQFGWFFLWIIVTMYRSFYASKKVGAKKNREVFWSLQPSFWKKGV